jgi:hypothetical protein
MDKHSEERRPMNWAAVAAIAAVLSVIVAILTNIKSDEYNIRVAGDYATFSVPGFFDQKLKDYLASIDPEIINSSLKSERSAANIDFKEPAMNLSKYFEQVIGSEDISQLQGLRSFWTFSVSNQGDKEVTGLRLHLPFDGYYMLKGSEENVLPSNFKSKSKYVIELGQLRSLESITVLVWSKSEPSRAMQKSIRITHPNGGVNIEYPVRVSGLLGWIYDSMFFQIIICFVFLFIISIVVWMLRTNTVLRFVTRSAAVEEIRSTVSPEGVGSSDVLG